MMDVAMASSVQALQDEAHQQRRALAEQGILCDEVRASTRWEPSLHRLTLTGDLRACACAMSAASC